MPRKLEEWVEIAERLVRIFGKVPSSTWLRTHGYSSLYDSMYHHPEVFKHLKRLEGRPCKRTDEDCKELIKHLSADNYGVLPPPAELRKMGFAWLISRLERNQQDLLGKVKWQHGRKADQAKEEMIRNRLSRIGSWASQDDIKKATKRLIG